MAVDGTTGRDHEAEGPSVFDEAWARSGVPESSVRRTTSLPPRAPGGANVTGAPAGPRDWTPPRTPKRRRAWPALLVFLVALVGFAVAFGVNHDSGPTSPPIAGGSATAPESSVPTDSEPRVEGLTPTTSVGSCFDLHGSVDIIATFMPCDRRHQLQLVGIERATGTNKRFPADTYWNGPVQRRCTADVAAYSHQPQRKWPPQLTEEEFIPRRAGWATGDRTIYCAGRFHPQAGGSLRHLHAYHPRHAPIANRPAPPSDVTPPSSAAGSSVTTTISGTLGLVQRGFQVCLTVTTDAGAAGLQPFGDYSTTWQINNGVPDPARSGIATGTHPSASDIVRHLGSIVTLTGSYAADAALGCGATREFDFSGVR